MRINFLFFFTLLLSPVLYGQNVTLGHLEDFEGASLAGWKHNAANPDAPRLTTSGMGNVYLTVSASGAAGSAGSRLIMNNTTSDWTGDFGTAGITRMQMDVANSGPTALNLRIAIQGPGPIGRFASALAVSLPADGVWRTIKLPITAADLVGVDAAAGTPAAGLSDVAELRILSAAAPAWRGDTLVAALDVDNIQLLGPPDDDMDGVVNADDNCPQTPNPTQEDTDFDGVGDACDLCPGFSDGEDFDRDGIPDACDLNPQTPVLYYDFEEGMGTTITNHGAIAVNGILNGAGGDERWVASTSDSFSSTGAIRFDGENRPGGDIINTQLTADELGVFSNNYTMAAWIQLLGTNHDNFIFGQTNLNTQVLHNGIRDPNDDGNFRAHLGHWGQDITAATSLQTGAWYHVIWEYADGLESIYLNGIRDGGPAARNPLSNPGIIAIGGSRLADWGFDGVLDEIVIYNQALSRGQILHLAAGGDPLNLPGQGGLADSIHFTAPFGTNGTWNLYEVVGVDVGQAQNWITAETIASNKLDPSGLTSLPGHLADVSSAAENFTLSRMSGFRTIWIGLTDDDIIFNGTEAVNNRNGGWVWTSGAPYTYQNWNNNEPNDSGAEGEDAIQLVANSGRWNDHRTGFAPQTNNVVTSPYIIEWATGSSLPVPGVPVLEPLLPQVLPGPIGGDGTFGVQSVSGNGNIPQIGAAIDSLMSGNGVISNGVALEINFSDPEGPAGSELFRSGNLPYVGNTTNLDLDIVHIYQGRMVIPSDGEYTFGVRSDDGCALRVAGQAWTNLNGNAILDPMDPGTIFTPFGGGNFRGVLNLTAGEYDIELVVFQDGGDSGHELFAAAGNFANEGDSQDWLLVGHPPLPGFLKPGIMEVNGTNFLVRTSAPGGNPTITNLTSLADAETELANDPNIVSHGWDLINFADPNGVGRGTFGNNNAFDNDTGGADNEFALEITAKLEIATEGDYIFGFRGDDGSILQIVGQTFSNIVFAPNATTMITGDTLSHDVNTGDSNSGASIHLAQGSYDLRVVYWEAGGGASLEVYGYDAKRPFVDLLRAGPAGLTPDSAGLALVAQSTPADILLSNPAYAGGMFSLSWTSEPGATYKVQWSIGYATWNDILPTVPSQGAETLVSVADTFDSPFVVFRVIEE